MTIKIAKTPTELQTLCGLLRREGKTYKEIGSIVSEKQGWDDPLSIDRVRRMTKKYEQALSGDERPRISTRVKEVLRKAGLTLKDVREMPSHRRLRIPGIGRKALQEIEEVLDQ